MDGVACQLNSLMKDTTPCIDSLYEKSVFLGCQNVDEKKTIRPIYGLKPAYSQLKTVYIWPMDSLEKHNSVLA